MRLHSRAPRCAIPLLLASSTPLLLSLPEPLSARQTLAEATATPEQAAQLFIRSIRAIRWDAAAQFLHAETLERFHITVTMIADADETGGMRRYLTGTDSAGYTALDAPTVFDRSLSAMIEDMPGLMHAFYDHDDELLGHVMEGADTAHVVYRTQARLSGSVPEVNVMQLVRTSGGWRVLWSEELEVLDTALRGVARGGG
jgi:hypothetical protein